MEMDEQLVAGQTVVERGRVRILRERADRFGLERWLCEDGGFVYAADVDAVKAEQA